jgi:hypothetical protein
VPLREGGSSETISDNIGEMLESPTFGPGKSKKKRRQMASAAAHRKARSTGTVSRAAMRKKGKC